MTDNSINNRMFASIHLNLLDNINLQAVADDFASNRNTNKLFWVTITLIVQRLIIDIKLSLKGYTPSCNYVFSFTQFIAF